MSAGDVISDIQTVANLAFLTYQPAAGIEIMLLGVTTSNWVGVYPDRAPDASLELMDGVNHADIANEDFNPTYWQDLKVFIDNVMYLYLQNVAGVQTVVAYYGIQTK